MSNDNLAESGRAGDRRVCRGQMVFWEGDRYRVLRRRVVDGFAMIQTCTHEVYLASLTGGTDPEWVPENEVEAAGA